MSPEISSIAVVYMTDGWRIVTERRRWLHYPYRVDAEEAALRLAAKARAQGTPTEVLVQYACGQLRRVVA